MYKKNKVHFYVIIKQLCRSKESAKILQKM